MTDAATATGVNGSMDIKNYTNTDTEYTYNRNGAMNKDLNKGISDIQYNSLNLPRMLDIKSPVAEGRNEYTYTASGVKLKVVQKWNPNYSTTPVIGSDVNTSLLTKIETTDYIGNIVYESHSDGTSKTKILFGGGYVENNIYYYFLSDHLGNNRIVVKSDGTESQTNMFYAFGASTAPQIGGAVQSYKYNGKELDQMHGLNLYDYSARYYESAIGRFTSVDPHAEKYYSISPYAYTLNNPIRLVDPDGRDPIDDLTKTISTIGKQVESFFGINQSSAQGVEGAIQQMQQLEAGGARAQSASNYIGTVNEALTTIHPAGSTITVVGKAAAGQDVTAKDLSYAALELPIIGTVGKLGKVVKTVDKAADAVKVADKVGDASRVVSKSKTTTSIGDKFTKTTKTLPGKGGGQSRAEYVTYKNKAGKTVRTYKDSYDRGNKFQHRKPLRGGPEGRPAN